MDDRRRVVVAAVAQMVEEEAEEEERIAVAVARIGAEIIMELEEGEGFTGASWAHITVNMDEYRFMMDSAFKLHFRMSRAVFEELLLMMGNHLIVVRERTPLSHILLMVIWLLATPDSFRSVALRFGVVPGTLYHFYGYIIKALRELAPRYIKWPNQDEREAIKQSFQRASGFPGIIGSIDGTHVFITAPVDNPAPYFSYHHSYSINVQAVVDVNLLVRHVHVGEAGSMNDNRVFKRSTLYADLLRDRDGVFCSNQEHLVGDGAYTLTDFMMIPFPHNNHLTQEERNYNRRLSQCRVRVENAFARAKGKWRRLKFMAARNPAVVVDHITASFVLHNFTILNGEQIWDADELARPIRHDQVLRGEEEGDRNDGEEDGIDLDELQAAAEDRGSEKRLHIMNVLNALAEEENEEVEEENIDDPL